MSERLGPNHPIVWIVGFVAAVLGIVGFLSHLPSTGNRTVPASPPSAQTGVAHQADTTTTIAPTTTVPPPTEPSAAFPSVVVLSDPSAGLMVDSASFYQATVSVNGQSMQGFYSPSYWGPDVHADFNLSRGYKNFTARVGITDDSKPGAPAHLTIRADGIEIYSGSFSLGQSKNLKLNVNNVLRLRFEWDQLSLDIYGGVGMPTVTT